MLSCVAWWQPGAKAGCFKLFRERLLVLLIFFVTFYFIDFYCCFSSTFLCWKLRLLILDHSSFLIYAFDAINIPVSTAFPTFHKLW